MGGADVAVFREVLEELEKEKKLGSSGVKYDPYGSLEVKTSLLAIIRDGEPVDEAESGDTVEIILPETHFYIESGGQVSDSGLLRSGKGRAGRSASTVCAGRRPGSSRISAK